MSLYPLMLAVYVRSFTTFWLKVSKKDKKVEVSVKDIERHNQPVQQIFIGDRLIGEVVTDNERFKAMLISNQSEFYVRSQEEGLEIVLQQYHLHQH